MRLPGRAAAPTAAAEFEGRHLATTGVYLSKPRVGYSVGADRLVKTRRFGSTSLWDTMNISAEPARLAALAAVPLLLLALFEPLHAQRQPASIVGTVLDAITLTPLPGSVVSLVDLGREVRSDADGNFVLTGVPGGLVTVRAALEGYSSSLDQVELSEGEIGFVQVQLLPVSTVLNEVLVMTGRRSGSSEARVSGEGRETANSAADLLDRHVPGLNLGRGGGVGTGTRMTIRGVSSFTLSTLPAIYLDGVRISNHDGKLPNTNSELAVLDDLPASHVKRIRVLKGPSAAAQFADSANGVILIETYGGQERR